MKKLFRNVVALAAALVAVSSVAQAQGKPIVYRFEKSVAAGAVINSTYRDTGNLSRITIACDNSLNASTTGTLTINYLGKDSNGLCSSTSPVMGTFTVTCANSGTNGGYTFVQIASDQPGVTTTGLVQIPIDPPACFQASLAAAGSVARQLAIYGR